MAVTLDPKVDEKLRGLVAKREALARQLSDPSVMSDMSDLSDMSDASDTSDTSDV